MSPRLLFPDAPSAADALTFAQRAARLGDGSVRLRARRGTLALTSAPLAPQGLLDATPTVLGMRMVRVDPELECDIVVEATTVAAVPDDPRALLLPEMAVSAPWAGISPPRSGWEAGGGISAATLAERAQWGIAAVAEAVPEAAGEEIVRAVRADVWGRADDDIDGLPLGVAFAAFALGFIGGEEVATVRSIGPWTRLSLVRGHVLTRGTVRSGLTGVRATGPSV
ncbi:hypothetical protein [Microbacterium sp.]|uniref:hypothetical protein n=1 Tax=Microbacterium sp. TaxID=51671 RepID=UPI0025DEE221|nr:hypothetical protein [Microbacterium sp.]